MEASKSLMRLLVICLMFFSCKGFSVHPIDEEPLIRLDESLVGRWKAVEDTDRANFITVRKAGTTDADLQNELISLNDSEIKRHEHYKYYITYWNQHGKNQYYEDFGAYLSMVNGVNFLNVMGISLPHEKIKKQSDMRWGYYFVHLSTSKRHDSVTIKLVADPTLYNLKSSKEVREKVTKNIDNPKFYSHTFHFYRVK